MKNLTKQGMRVIPAGEKKCIWMESGVVSYKLCTNQYQCNICDFDLAMSNRVMKTKIVQEDNKPKLRHKKEITAWMKEFRNSPADQRKCRYMLNGDVSYKICPNSFRCGECSFDQMMQDRSQPVFDYKVNELDQAAGFYMHQDRYYFRNHTWLELERNGKYRIGIDDFARRIIGKVNGINLPAVGKNLAFEEYCWTIQHDLGELEFFSPVKGIVDSINQNLFEDVDLITEKSYHDGWLMTIDPKSIMRSNKNFLKGEEARAWMIEESKQLNVGIYGESGSTLQDGATVSNNISRNLTKEQWDQLTKKHFFTR